MRPSAPARHSDAAGVAANEATTRAPEAAVQATAPEAATQATAPFP